MNRSLLIPVLALTAGVSFACGWLVKPGAPGGSDDPDQPSSPSRTSRAATPGGSGALVPGGVKGHVARQPEDEFLERFMTGGEISSEDMQAAMKAMMTENDPLLRRKMFAVLLDQLTPGNAREAYAALRESRRGGPGGRGGQGEEELRLLANAWGRIDGPGAIKALTEMREEREKERAESGDEGRGGRGGDKGGGKGEGALLSVLSGWATVDGAGAAAYVNGIEDDRQKQIAAVGVLRGMLVNGVDDAMGYINSMPATEEGDRARSFYMSMVAGEVLEQGVDAAKSWVGGISDPELRGGAMSRVAESIARRDLEGAVEWVSQYANDESATRAVARVAGEWARTDPEAVLEWAGDLPDATKARVVSQAFDRWADRDAVAAGEYLMDMPDSAAKDSAVGGFANELVRQEPATAIAWAESISDPELRTDTLTDVARRWYRNDQEAAATWLESSGLSEEAVQSVIEAPERDVFDRGRGRGGKPGKGGKGGGKRGR